MMSDARMKVHVGLCALRKVIQCLRVVRLSAGAQSLTPWSTKVRQELKRLQTDLSSEP